MYGSYEIIVFIMRYIDKINKHYYPIIRGLINISHDLLIVFIMEGLRAQKTSHCPQGASNLSQLQWPDADGRDPRRLALLHFLEA